MYETTLGFAASVLSFVLFVPQALRTRSLRKDPHALMGVSILTQVLILGNATLWAAYGAVTGAFWVAAPGILNAPLACAVILLVTRAKKTRKAQSHADLT